MEREMCSYLEWQLNVNPKTLRDSQSIVQLDFAGLGPYLPMVLPQPAPASFFHQSAGNNISSSMGYIPAFASRIPLSKDTPVIPSPSIRTYPSSPPPAVPQKGLPPSLNLSHVIVIGSAANAIQYPWGRIRQECVGRFEPGQGSCHPQQPRINLYSRKAC